MFYNGLRVSLGGRLATMWVRRAMRSSIVKRTLSNGTTRLERALKWKAPAGFTHVRFEIDGVPLEQVKKEGSTSQKMILLLHGGAYRYGLGNLYRSEAVRYCKISGGAGVLSVDYRIAPQHTYPAALEDTLRAWDYLMEKGIDAKDVVVAGDSAGGNLALVLALTLRERGDPLPRAMVLMSPWADVSGVGPSHRENLPIDAMFGHFSKDDNVHLLSYFAGTDLDDPHVSPVNARYDGFPSMLVLVGTHEVLLSDAQTVARKAREAGVSVQLSEYAGMFHVFPMFGNAFAESRRAWREVAAFLREWLA